MIIVGQKVYRTLEQDFYVNGKKVLKAYANGQKVYPEDGEWKGNLIKFRGRRTLNGTKTYSRYIPGLDGYEMEPYDCSISGSASFVCVLEFVSDRHDLFWFYTNGAESVNRANGFYDYFSFGADADLFDGDSDEEPINFNSMPIPGNNNEGLSESVLMHTNQNTQLFKKILFKQNVSSFRLPRKATSWTGSYFSPLTGYKYTVINENPYAWMIEEHNNKIYSLDEKSGWTTWYYTSKEYEESHSAIEIVLLPGGQTWPYSLRVKCRVQPRAIDFNIVDITKWGVPQEDKGGYMGRYSEYLFYTIPITEIMYMGNKNTAPEWARNVYESDLD